MVSAHTLTHGGHDSAFETASIWAAAANRRASTTACHRRSRLERSQWASTLAPAFNVSSTAEEPDSRANVLSTSSWKSA